MGRMPVVPGYEVLEPLGQGASATVWRARRRGDGLDVALKILTPAGADVAAGLREAGLLAGVRHRHVVRLYDVVPLADPETGRATSVALATQLAGGGSLAQVLSRRRILSAGEVVTALQPIAGALADLHGQAVVHGDLSTGNLLFLRDGMPLLADLGAARITGAPTGDPEGTGALSGLVAPEVVEGFPPTQESDVYQLGAVAWLCLAGQPPGPVWSRGSLEELAPGLPAGMADLVTRCLAPEPADRPDAEEVALALLATATPEPVEVAPDADPGHGLTERLRRQAREDLEPAAEDVRRLRLFRGPRRGRGAAARSGSHRPERVPTAGDGPVGWRLRRTAGLTWAVVAVLLLLGAGAALPLLGPDVMHLVRGAGHAGSPPSPPPDTSGGGVAPPDTSGGEVSMPPDTSGGETPRLPVTAPGQVSDLDAAAALQVLVDGRAHAWETGDLGALKEVLAIGSPAMTTETATLARAAEQGLTYPDVSFSVNEAAVVETEDEGRLTVDAVVTREPLRGLDVDGQVVVEEPRTTEEVRLVLSRASGSAPWRLWSWEPG